MISEIGEYPDYVGTRDNLGIPDKLAFLAGYGDQFIAVVGKAGRGKSAISQIMIDELTCVGPTAVIEDRLKTSELVAYLYGCFELEPVTGENSTAVKRLSKFATDLAQQGKKPVVVVDEACQMKDAVLKAVLGICDRCGLGLVLFGNKSLLKKRSIKSFSHRIYTCQLDRMTDKDLKSYIRRHSDEDLQISEAQLDNILERSDGIPQKIDRMVEDLVNDRGKRLGVPLMHMSVVVVLAVVLIGAWSYDMEFEDKQTGSPETEAGQEGFSAIRLGPDPFSKQQTGHAEDLPENLTDYPTENANSVAGMVTTPEFIQLPVTEQPVTEQPLPDSSVIGQAEQDGLLNTSGSSQDRKKAVAKIIEARNQRQPETGEADRDLQTESVQLGREIPVQQRNWIVEAKDTDYTLQLMGSHSEPRILAFIDAQGGTDEFAYFETRHRNEFWYVLTVGQYSSRNEALAAISGLPPGLR